MVYSKEKLMSLCSEIFLSWLLQKHKTKLIFTLLVLRCLVFRLINLISWGQACKSRPRKQRYSSFAEAINCCPSGLSKRLKLTSEVLQMLGSGGARRGGNKWPGMHFLPRSVNSNKWSSGKFSWILFLTIEKEGFDSKCKVAFCCSVLCMHNTKRSKDLLSHL